VTLGREFKETFEVCPVCVRPGREKSREVPRGGTDTATLEVDALVVCLRCSERLYPEDTVKGFSRGSGPSWSAARPTGSRESAMPTRSAVGVGRNGREPGPFTLLLIQRVAEGLTFHNPSIQLFVLG
jgi:hypothetical protein